MFQKGDDRKSMMQVWNRIQSKASLSKVYDEKIASSLKYLESSGRPKQEDYDIASERRKRGITKKRNREIEEI
jgi:hypothetical protein